ncbi:MAG: hypothetical protein ACE5J7_04300 [Candidatus Aenigmatarchaeota archaeon]
MEIRIKYKLRPEELVKKIAILKRKKKQDTEEWFRLNRAYREYEESGELFLSEEEIFKVQISELRKLLTPERLILLETIKYSSFDSITGLARAVKRDIKNVYEDLKIFERFGLIKVEGPRKGKKIIVLVEKISVDI